MYSKLRETMKHRSLSQNRLAMDARISPCDFSKAINGKMPFYPSWRKRIADALEMTTEDLFGNEEQTK